MFNRKDVVAVLVAGTSESGLLLQLSIENKNIILIKIDFFIKNLL